jgi:ABC-type phosphate/phosphonate transport system substrate-binding protein
MNAVRQRRHLARIIAVLCLLLFAGGATRVEGTDAPAGRKWRFGYSASLFVDVSRADAKTALTLWSRELLRNAGLPTTTEVTIYEALPDLEAAIRKGQIDLIALSPMDYVAVRDRAAIEPAVIGTKYGKKTEEQLLLVHAGRGIDTLEQLRGRSVAVAGSWPGISSMWLDTVLAKRGLPLAERFFGGVKAAAKAQQAILAVFFKQADACLVGRNAFRTASELNPQIGSELTVLLTSPAYPSAVTSFRASIDGADKEAFLTSSLKLIASPVGRQILTLFHIDGIDRMRPGDLEALTDLVREHKKLASPARAQGAR